MPFRYTISQIAEGCGGSVIRCPFPEALVYRVITDSRTVIIPEGCIFFALTGERHDGHNYIKPLADRGVKVFVVSDPDRIENLPAGCCFIRVGNTLDALQRFAAFHRQQFSLPVAAITGSNGKTIVKEWIAQLMPAGKALLRSPMSYNSQVGVPLSVLLLDEPYDLALFEAGISKPGEMEKLEAVIQPTLGVFTGIGPAHDEYFTDRKEKILEKLELFRHVSDIVCFDDEPDAFELLNGMAERKGIRLFTIGNHPGAELAYKVVDKESYATHLEIDWQQQRYSIHFPFTDEASLRNGLLCLGTLLLLGCNAETCVKGLSRLEPVAMRMEQVEGLQECILINDSYNNDLLALRIALDHLLHQNQRPRRTLILSDIYQSGLDASGLLQQLTSLLNTYPPDRFIGIGPMVQGLKGKLTMETWFYDSTEAFLQYHPLSIFSHEVILLKGARSFRFELIMERLQRKSHRTILEVNLQALVNNLNFFRSKLDPGTSVMAMVKAASYGAGNFEIASVLQYQQVQYLAVAYADEGVELRKAGITVPVMVMNPEPGSYQQMIAHHLEPEIYSFGILEEFAAATEARYHADGIPYPVHIEIDTGMHRLGFNPDEVVKLIRKLLTIPSLTVRSVFSHLATADDSTQTAFARQQIAIFKDVRELFVQHYDHGILFHILNSAGILNFPEARFDMVRPGIGLYGIASDPMVQKQLQQVFTLSSVVSQIREVPAGDSIGYNRSFVAPDHRRIATIAIGYADGFSRKLGNGVGKVRIHDAYAPVVGDVCMDMIMADITDIPEVKEGDDVVIFDDKYLVSEIASLTGTIPYEVLTSVAARVKRVYLKEN
ncbi:MAG TPA: bifunctional UDP-N-acetylmuramoyl-tripeptide:D-alanyl-D-alanine ligase/alanine racemase [Bacteroidales bacterium]|nr:bifunctional UDP-N-acetylmuramoyl-tripeptide:D-alanyl-D-alanine ligase/alanine racemase [Bacteroidales bacterium]HRZ47925.1 bifunctional UDP-N-acetylmuramoyl-tripeptide:D-alanyl-D-alanine ligase/alanine racemase [Bacteroidales bacterium]